MNSRSCLGPRPLARILLLAVLAGCGGSVAPPALPPTMPEGPAAALQVIAFGDSLTAGKDLPDPDREAWPALVEARLRAEGVDAAVVNSGVSGNTTFDALDRLDYSIDSGVDLVIVCLGSNDAFQGKPLKLVEENLRRIVEGCQERGARVLLVALKTLPNFGPEYGSAYEAIFPRVARTTGATLAPFLLEGVAGDRRYNLPDGIHPNGEGHARVAENLYPAIREAITESMRSR